jgi:mannose-6-phosphate isomerase-like protein (cupin superfamily)
MPPKIVSIAEEANTQAQYENHPIADVNNHVVRISVMTQPYHWHHHPDSDETFLSIEGELIIEFEDGTQVLRPGELITVPKGVRHRTRPGGARSVNLTIEARDADSVS